MSKGPNIYFDFLGCGYEIPEYRLGYSVEQNMAVYMWKGIGSPLFAMPVILICVILPRSYVSANDLHVTSSLCFIWNPAKCRSPCMEILYS